MEKKKNSSLDVLRIIAAFMVLTCHIGIYCNFDYAIGAKGVQLFFVMSGYLAVVSLGRNSNPLQYYKNRAVRILPTYWFCLVLIYIKDLIVASQESSISDVLAVDGQCGPGVWRYITMMHCVLPSKNWDMWNNHNMLWTMSSFMVFYLLVPWIYRLFGSFFKSCVLTVLLLLLNPFISKTICVAFSNYPVEAHIDYYSVWNPIVELYCFMLGVTLFFAIQEKREIIYLLFLGMAMCLTGFQWYAYEIGFTLILFVALSRPMQFEKGWINIFVGGLSKGSFALYLIHPVILKLITMLTYEFSYSHVFVYTVFLYLVCIAGSYGIYFGFIARIEDNIFKKVMLK